MVLAQTGHAEFANDVRGQSRADGALRVLDIVGELHLRSELQRRAGVADHQRVERIRNIGALAVARASLMTGTLGLNKDRIKVEIVEGRIAPADLGQKIGPADDLLERREAERCQDLANLLGKMGEELNNLFRRSLELRPKIVALRADADRAGVGVTLADHDAAHRDQRRCADTVFVGAEHCRHDNVAAGLQATVGAEHDLVAKIVHAQDLMHFRQAHFPRQAGMLDRGLRAGAGAAAMS